MMSRTKVYLKISIVFCLSFFVFADRAFSQGINSGCESIKDTLLNRDVFIKADKIPEPADGSKELLTLLNKQLKFRKGEFDYSGKIIVAFVIEADGSITGFRKVKDPTGLLFKQILPIVEQVIWKPALCKGNAVSFLYHLPLNVCMQE